jgi:uncharacterized protein (TIGR00730 family)
MPETMGTDPNDSPQLRSPSYALAVQDTAFLLRDEMRAMRFALEYAKADLLLRDWGVRSTIIVFGSARVASPEQLAAAEGASRTEADREVLARLRRQVGWYEAARAFGRIASERGGALADRGPWLDNVIVTGGGPGIMEAANRGAQDAGALSIGLNISIPHEQAPNPFITPQLSFRFHYFAMRKMHFAMRARALVIFPGGFGTLDELFELLTLSQTGKAPAIPVVLYDRAFWTRIINFEALAETGMISPQDLGLFDIVDDVEEAWESLTARGLLEGTGAS